MSNIIIKKFIVFLFVFVSVFSLVKTKYYSVNAQNVSSEILMEVNSNRVLYEENSNKKAYMASTTKILTAIVVIENCNLEDNVIITDKTVGVEGSSIYLVPGEELSVKHLLYGLMLRSGNDCAETLAVHCSGSIEEFASLMNDTAIKIGAKNSNFVNPHGLHDDNHYTTAYDLALISCYAIKNPIFKEIVSTKSVIIPHTKQDYDRKLINKNKMLKEYDGATGIKTGYTKKAGRCLVSSCEKNGMELVSVVLNCGPMFERSKFLLDYGYDNYKMIKIVESDNIIGFTSFNDNNYSLTIKNDVILPLTDKERNMIKIEYDFPEKIDKEPKNNQEMGLIKIFLEKNLLFTEKIYTI